MNHYRIEKITTRKNASKEDAESIRWARGNAAKSKRVERMDRRRRKERGL